MVSIDQNKCIGCGMCVKDCFYSVISVQNGKAQVSNSCFECGHCVAVCPTKAVSIPNLPMEEVLECDDSCKMNPDNLLHFMQFRRSVRQFKADPIPKETLATILEAGRYTPTAGNRQDVSFVVVQDAMAEIKPLLWDILGKMVDSGKMGPYTPLLRIVCDKHNFDPNEDRLFCHANAMVLMLTENPMNGGLAATSIELMAQSMGIGVLYSGFLMGAINRTPEIRERLKIKDNQQLAAVMLMGVPDVKYQRTAPRKKANIIWE